MGTLGVEAQEVVPVQTCSGGWCVEVAASMWAVEVVVVQPWVELGLPFC
jgi:hypothetical protein